MKKIPAFVLMALLALFLTVPAWAAPEDGVDGPDETQPILEEPILEEPNLEEPVKEEADVVYTGTVIDPFQGTPVTNGAGDSTSAGTRVTVSSGVWYDSVEKVYILSTGDGEMTANVVNDMVTTQAVSIGLGEEAGYACLYRNGVMVTDANLKSLNTPGKYILKLGQPDDPQAFTLQFTILNAVSGTLNRFDVPIGFSVVNVMKDGELFPWSSGYVDLSQEGDYEIGYRCLATNVKYDLNFTVDHTPPVLALAEVVDGRASGPVDLSDLEEGASISATLNGSPLKVGNRLTNSGNYVLTVTDAAGNTNTYQFQIMVYFNNNSFVFFAVLLLLIGALCAYLIYSRKRLRIS